MANNVQTKNNKQLNMANDQQDVKIKYEYTLDEAIEATQIGKYQMMLVFFGGLSIMGAALENVNFSYVLPYAKCELNLTITQQGVLNSVSFLGIVSTSYLWGFLVDTWGRQKVLRLAAFSGFIFSSISALLTNVTLIIVMRFLAGAFLAGAQAGAFSYVSEFHTAKLAPRAVAFASIFLSGLAIFMASAAILIIPMDWTWYIFDMEFKPWRLFLICNSLLNLCNGIIFSFLPESPKFLVIINENERALQILRRVYAFNTGSSEESFPVKSIKSEIIEEKSAKTAKGCTNIISVLWKQTKPVFLSPLLTHTWKISYLIFVIFAIGHGTFMWFPDFLVQLQNYKGPPKTLCNVVKPSSDSLDMEEMCQTLDNKNILSYQILFIIGVCFLTSGALSSYFMKKISPKWIISGWILLSAGTCISINFLADFYPIVISLIIFLSCCSCANIVMSVAVNLFPTKYRGTATAFILMCGRLGGFTGSNIVGILLANSCEYIFYINAALLISCIFIFLTVKTSGKSSDKENAESK